MSKRSPKVAPSPHVPVHAMNAHWGGGGRWGEVADVYLHSFSTTAPDEGKWSKWRPEHFNARQEPRYPLDSNGEGLTVSGEFGKK